MECPALRPEGERRSPEVDGTECFASRADELGIPGNLSDGERRYLADIIDRRDLFKKADI